MNATFYIERNSEPRRIAASKRTATLNDVLLFHPEAHIALAQA